MADDHRRPFYMDPIRQFFSYSRSERNGIVVLLLLIAGVLAVKTYIYFMPVNRSVEYDPQFEKEIARFESDTLIELNRATKMELMNLPGVGPSFAERILEYRDALGGFIFKEQLLDVQGVGPAKFSKMQAYIKVDTALMEPIKLQPLDTSALYGHPYLDSSTVEVLISTPNKYNFILEISKDRVGADSLMYRYFTP